MAPASTEPRASTRCARRSRAPPPSPASSKHANSNSDPRSQHSAVHGLSPTSLSARDGTYCTCFTCTFSSVLFAVLSSLKGCGIGVEGGNALAAVLDNTQIKSLKCANNPKPPCTQKRVTSACHAPAPAFPVISFPVSEQSPMELFQRQDQSSHPKGSQETHQAVTVRCDPFGGCHSRRMCVCERSHTKHPRRRVASVAGPSIRHNHAAAGRNAEKWEKRDKRAGAAADSSGEQQHAPVCAAAHHVHDVYRTVYATVEYFLFSHRRGGWEIPSTRCINNAQRARSR